MNAIDPLVAPTFAQLWPNRSKALSPKVEWLFKTDDGYEAEYNFTRIVRAVGWTSFLKEVEDALVNGERRVGKTEGGLPVRESGGIGTLGLTLDNAQMAFFQEPVEMRDGEWLTEFTLRRVNTPVEEGSVRA